MTTEKLPYVPPELLDYLDRQYPDRFPDAPLSDKELWMRAGEVRLIRKLRDIFKDLHEESLANNVSQEAG